MMGDKRNWRAARLCRFSIFLAALLALATGGAQAAPEGSRFNTEYFSNLPVVTHEGKTVPFYDGLIKGKTVVFNFIYLTCNDICPLTTSRVAEIRKRLGDEVGRDVFIYSMTMDPERDTPELLKEYADAFGAGDGWLFLTGKPEDIKKIRWRLGERSRNLTEHRNDLVLGNDKTGEWHRTSVYVDMDIAVRKIRELDPVWRDQPRAVKSKGLSKKRYRIDDRPGQALFAKACSTCHSIGKGDLVGPDLKDLTKRRERDWLSRFLKAPEKMRAQKDPLTVALSRKYKGVIMPNLGLEDPDIADLLTYIEARSTSENEPKPRAEASSEIEAGD